MKPTSRPVTISRKIQSRAELAQEALVGLDDKQAVVEAVIAQELGLGDWWESKDRPAGLIAPRIWAISDDNEGLLGDELESDVVISVGISNPTQAIIHGWWWGNGHLNDWPPPVWRGEVIRPRRPDEAKDRTRAKSKCVSLKRGSKFPLLCPRCGWGAKHLVFPYFESPWRVWGGICPECCVEAEAHYDATEWPENCELNNEITENEALRMIKGVFGLKGGGNYSRTQEDLQEELKLSSKEQPKD